MSDKPLAFEGAVADLLDLINSVSNRARTDKEKLAVKRAKAYKMCFKQCEKEQIIETHQIPLYARFEDSLADRTDELLGYSWLSEPMEVIYVNRRGKPDPELSLDLTVLFRLCNTESETARFVSYLLDAIRFSTGNVSFARKLEHVINLKDQSISYEENAEDEENAGNPLVHAMREIKKTFLSNPNTIGEVMGEMSGMMEMANTPMAQEFIESLGGEDGSINVQDLPEKFEKAKQILSKNREQDKEQEKDQAEKKEQEPEKPQENPRTQAKSQQTDKEAVKSPAKTPKTAKK